MTTSFLLPLVGYSTTRTQHIFFRIIFTLILVSTSTSLNMTPRQQNHHSQQYSAQQQQQQHHHQHQHQGVPQYNGVNPHYPGLRMLNSNPPVYCVDNFLSEWECQFLIQAASDSFTPAPVVGKGAGEVSNSRTSSTCYLAREDLPDLMRKVSALTGKPVEHCELPQVGRYFSSQQYYQVRRLSRSTTILY